MTDVVPYDTRSAELAAPGARQIDGLISAWLHAKHGRSGSGHTRRAYADAIGSFRAALALAGMDVDGRANLVALIAQGWAAQSASGRSVGAATYNRKLAIVSSFYAYAGKAGALAENPISRVERRQLQRYANSQAVDARGILARIDTSTLAGLRDYAILAVALTTGRRVAELAGLRIGDCEIAQRGSITLHFRRTKGGKTMRDTLPNATSAAVLRFLHAAHANIADLAPDAPLWPSYGRASAGQAIGVRALQLICDKHAGAHFHQLRHTFAKSMELAGAPISTIQQRLGHSSAATTSIYLAALRSDENPHADALAEHYGIE